MNINLKTMGFLLIGISIILFVALSLVKIDFDSQSASLCELYDSEELSMEQCPAHNNNTSWIFLIGFGIAFLILGFGVYLVFALKPAELEKKEFKLIDLSQLDEEEKKIYEIIKSKNGSVFQSDLINATDFSKVKISRILDKLESKNVLERKRRGMTNIIVLK